MKRTLCILLSLGLLMAVVSAVTAQSTGCTDATGASIPCPPDRDGDGVPDSSDRCISDVGPASNNGCPESNPGQSGGSGTADSDGDGIADSSDQCATVAGTSDYAGCPGPSPTPIGDADADGENDAIDRCPNQPGPAENAGCPLDTAPAATPQPTARPIPTGPTFPESSVCLATVRVESQNNLKQMALANAPSVGTMPQGEFVPVLSAVINDQGETWFLTELGGYVRADDVFINDKCVDLPTERLIGSFVFPAGEGACQVVSTIGVNVRGEPSLNGAVVGTLTAGQPYEVTSTILNTEGTWYRVQAGWVSASVVTISGQCARQPLMVEPSGFSISQVDYDALKGGIYPDSHCFDLFNGTRYCHTILKATADDDGATEGWTPGGITVCGFGPSGVKCTLIDFTTYVPEDCIPELCGDPNPNPYPLPDPYDPNSGEVYCNSLINDLALPTEGDNTPYYTVYNPDGSVVFGAKLQPVDPRPCLVQVFIIREDSAANGQIPVDRIVFEIELPSTAATSDYYLKIDTIEGESEDAGRLPSISVFELARLDLRGTVCIPVTHGNFVACPGVPQPAPTDIGLAPSTDPILDYDLLMSFAPNGGDPTEDFTCDVKNGIGVCVCNNSSSCQKMAAFCGGSPLTCYGNVCGCGNEVGD